MDVPFRCPLRVPEVLALRFQHSKGTMPRPSSGTGSAATDMDKSEVEPRIGQVGEEILDIVFGKLIQ